MATMASEAAIESPPSAAGVKQKKERSSKKRKAAAVVESTEQAPSTPKEDEESQEHDDDSAGRPTKKRKSLVAEEIEVDVTKPEPPSKKALRALKKGKLLPLSKSGAESASEAEEKVKAKKTEVEKRSEHGIWIGNLSFHVSKEDLRTFFTEKSDLTEEMITRIHMPSPNDSKPANKVSTSKFKRVEHNKGFAYVDFDTAKGVEIALELSEELLSGRRVLIKNQKSFEGRPEKTKAESRMEGKPPSTRVFLGNLSFDTTEESLTEHFEKCGPIESIKIATFEDSGKCKGFAWIVFQDLEAAKNAVRGWVHIEEELSDSGSESGDEGNAEEGDAASEPKVKKTKKRKWWVNKIKGRPLRMEFAEDAQVRYKKRYGKDGTKAATARPVGEEGVSEENTVSGNRPVKVVEYRQPYAARLTGGIVESKGSKVKF